MVDFGQGGGGFGLVDRAVLCFVFCVFLFRDVR